MYKLLLILATIITFLEACETGKFGGVFFCLLIYFILSRITKLHASKSFDVSAPKDTKSNLQETIRVFFKKYLFLLSLILSGCINIIVLFITIVNSPLITASQNWNLFFLNLFLLYINTRITQFFATKYKAIKECSRTTSTETISADYWQDYAINNTEKKVSWYGYKNKYKKSYFKNTASHYVKQIKAGYDFEKYCAEILNKYGWNASTTKSSGDQGVDIIATKDSIKVAIQCKYHSHPQGKTIGNRAVQEVNAGSAVYNASYAAVVTNSSYTPSARELARANNVLLLLVEELCDLEQKIKSITPR